MKAIRGVGVCALLLLGCPGAGGQQGGTGPGGGGGGGETPIEGPSELSATEGGKKQAARDPGTTLIDSEKAIWTLEGMLLAEADAALRTPEAKQVLGEPSQLRYSETAEAKVRKFLRQKRSKEARVMATEFVASLNQTSRAMLASVGGQTGLSVEDVLMDYLTYDALYDLAMMRYGHKRWKAGAYSGDAKALADSFFSLVPDAPSAKHGIKVVSAEGGAIEISVFGGRVMEKVGTVDVREVAGVGKVGVVEWSSNYEQLRAGIRGQEKAVFSEELEWHDGAFLVNYAVELDEYLSWGAGNPWASMLYMASADEVADMYAGVAAAGGFQAGAGVELTDLEKLPQQGELGVKGKGLTVKVLDARQKPRLGNHTSRRGQFLVVTVSVKSTLKSELRAPSEWFRLATAAAEYPELGVARPGMAPALLPLATRGASMLGMPYTSIKAGKTVTLVLVYDVPAETKLAALLLGANELALQVAVK